MSDLVQSPNGKYPVHMIKKWKGYNAGDVAGFEMKTSAALCSAGLAKPYGEAAAEESKPMTKAEKKAAKKAEAEAKAEANEGSGVGFPGQ